MKFGFNITFDRLFDEQTLKYETSDFNKELKKVIKDAIDKKDISVIYKHSDVVKNWFPKGGYHIFISHSHKDANTAKYIANKLYDNYGIKSFIDSEFWGHVDAIISEINHEHFPCGDNNEYLIYDSCMKVASNFYLILADALLDAINLTDSCWFLNTPNSIHCTDTLEMATFSPWIYSELKYTSVIERRWHPKRKFVATESFIKAGQGMEKISESANVSVEYIAPLEHLIPVSENTMNLIMDNEIGDIGNLKYQDDKCFYWLNSIYREMHK
ncbi:hypothetical protein [Enterobacter quasiroggenkampii]|uniref:hypothetical protein n=1 Tax=Enterobacter quasiroggenkampii TaxID=2497436 RepID=UPI0021D2C5F4|nr:hypothetical protein [Enterobacter quasiroggenkampii]MCU6368110.1 hypothetical protein [Enterobacter quasiroggenkampii]